MHRALALLLALALGGCLGFGDPDEPLLPDTERLPMTPTPAGPPLVFGGTLVDARTGAPLTNATVRIDLAQVQPCSRQGIGWTSWDAPVDGARFGPIEIARPRSDDVAFFLHARAPGYAENATMIGPAEARGDIRNLTLVMHPDAAIAGRAPPGTLVALDAPVFPRLALADAEGVFRFPSARVVEATLVADTPHPHRAVVAAPAELDIVDNGSRGWTLEGLVKGPSGAPLAADVVAFNGTTLVGVARSGESGTFSMPLPPEPMGVRVVARTADARYGATLVRDLDGPPALRETLLARALC